MAKLKFIHAADIHLGSPLHVKDQPPEEYKELFESATFIAFERIVDNALEYEVDFLLLAGDVYDEVARSIKANRFFNEQCQRLNENNIPVYIIAGNHDPLGSHRQIFDLPGNVFYFSAKTVEEKVITDDEDNLLAQILGQSYRTKSESRKMYSRFTPSTAGPFNIGLLHTQLNPNDSNYVPISQANLAEKSDIDYWALGHIHQCRIENNSNPVIAYSGIPQGRDFGEEGLGGCLLVEVDFNHNVEYKFIPTSSFVWKRFEINIDKDPEQTLGNLDDLKNLIIKEAKELASRKPDVPENLETSGEPWEDYFSGYIVQWVIKGRGELHNILREQKEEASEELIESLRRRRFASSTFVWTDSIKIKTAPPLPELDSLQQEENLVFNELSDIIELCREDDEWQDRLKNELGEIWEKEVDHENVDPEKFQLSDRIYDEILEQAKDLIIEKIVEGRS